MYTDENSYVVEISEIKFNILSGILPQIDIEIKNKKTPGLLTDQIRQGQPVIVVLEEALVEGGK
jgi:hypothetical protein